jgi:hypothetical protein
LPASNLHNKECHSRNHNIPKPSANHNFLLFGLPKETNTWNFRVVFIVSLDFGDRSRQRRTLRKREVESFREQGVDVTVAWE